jgi:methionyl-tRNA formyltransferase
MTRKITNAECRIDWQASALAVHDHIRGLSPFPGAFAGLDLGRGPERLEGASRRAGRGLRRGRDGAGQQARGGLRQGAVRLLQVQRSGSRALAADGVLRGVPVAAGSRFLASVGEGERA